MSTESIQLQQFQDFIDATLIRNKSVLDQTTKLQDACTHLCRTISKSATTCGCITIDVHKQPYNLPEATSLEALKTEMSTHVNGKLCEDCQEALEKECGRILFYLGAIANTFNISLESVMEKEKYRTEMLGKYSLK